MSDSVPINGTPEGNAHPSKTWIVLGLLVLAHAAFGACFNPNAQTIESGRIVPFLLLGVLFSQPILFAIWASFAHQRFYHRFLWSLFLFTWVSFAEALGILRHAHFPDLGILMIIDATLFFTATIILSVFRHFSRWRIKQPDREDAMPVYQTHQIGIKHLIILTTIIALACGLFRTLCIINPDMRLPPSIAKFIGGIFQTLALLFPVIVIPWITLAYRRRIGLLIGIMIILAGLFDIAACFLLIKMNSATPPFSAYVALALFQLGATISALATTLVIRFCRSRMIREPSV